MQDEEHTGRQHIEQRYAALREAGLKIDPSTADVTWHYGDTFDPYGIKDLPEEYRQSGRVYFARAPDSDVWVCFEDLPEETVEALWRRASDWGVLTPNNLPFFLEQNMMVTLRDHPELLFQYERLVESLDRTVEGLPDEGFKARWRRGGPRLKKLIDVAKREAGGVAARRLSRRRRCNAVDGRATGTTRQARTSSRPPRSKHRRRSARVECEHDAALAGVV